MIAGAVDLHKKYGQYFVDVEGTKPVETRLDNDPSQIKRFFDAFEKQELKIAVESTRNWYWLVDLLQEMGIETVLSNPEQTKAIAHARVKTDKVTAETITHLLRADLLPTCWIPEKAQRNLRELLRFRMKLVRLRTQVKNTLRSILAKHNIKSPHANLWGPKGREFLEGLQLGEPHQRAMDHCLQLLQLLNNHITQWDKEITSKAQCSAEADRLVKAPEIQKILAMTILSETGPIERFPNAKHYVNYCGLAPSTHASGGKVWHGHIGHKCNMTLRWAMVEVACRAAYLDDRWGSYYSRMKAKKGMAVARVALARKLAKMIYIMLKYEVDYEDYMQRGNLSG